MYKHSQLRSEALQRAILASGQGDLQARFNQIGEAVSHRRLKLKLISGTSRRQSEHPLLSSNHRLNLRMENRSPVLTRPRHRSLSPRAELLSLRPNHLFRLQCADHSASVLF